MKYTCLAGVQDFDCKHEMNLPFGLAVVKFQSFQHTIRANIDVHGSICTSMEPVSQM
ncbi:hypothetical protein SLEP1_g737 [Rubroshorea leprosula]|uniref:Uncharacterized protein n=1 Tax=Rubroshorea leprosula TaxID=152421 RepID=A0AAV5HBI2_9ROSI|nr:hypothetical protein SLEP1_g737 [Rubroshorea leprosula]